MDEPLLTIFEEVWVDQNYLPPGWRMPAGGVVVDIGANVGVFSVWAVRRAGARRVIALEPSESSVVALRANLVRNGLPEVTVCPKAVGARRGRALLYRRGPPAMNTLFSTDAAGSHFQELGPVEVVTLDDVFSAFAVERCDLLKLDCEGSEYDILSAASARTLGAIQAVAAEYHIGLNSGDPEALRGLLESSGFVVSMEERVGSEGGHLHAVRGSPGDG